MSRLTPLPSKGSPEYRWLISRRATSGEIDETVRRIVGEVRNGGDRVLLDLTERFDGVRLSQTAVSRFEMRAALSGLDPSLRTALEQMADRIERVHAAQRFHEQSVDSAPGVRVWREWRPFNRVGLYAPGGRTVYPSSVLMMAIPAHLAGCRQIVLCSPPQADGHIASAILAAAELAGVTEVHAVGGAQAIAALAYGTESIARVDFIAGPGNLYVTAAKVQVFGQVAIDMPAGPSELVIISDGSINATWLASDLRAQAEHSPDAISLLITTSMADAAVIQGLEEGQIKGYLCDSLERAVGFANDFGPEHLMLAVREPERHLAEVSNVGSVFLGPLAAAAAGDYATGANHVLPTGGSARSFGPLGLRSFGRAIQVQAVEASGVPALTAITDELASVERLNWHGASVRMRSQQ